MDAKTARRLLEQERARLETAREVMRARGLPDEAESDSFAELSPIDQHQADVASELLEHEVDQSLAAGLDVAFDEVNAALLRLAAGDYGTCQTCRAPIADERLEALPATRFCAEHERGWEARRLGLLDDRGPMPGERGRPLDDVMNEAARDAADFLPDEDEPDHDVDLGPEEAALHVLSERGEPGGLLTGAEIEQAEARHFAELVEVAEEGSGTED